MAKRLWTNEEIETVADTCGYSHMTVYYTGGGIYCFTANLTENLWINGDSEGMAFFSDEEPTDEEFGSPEWQESHNIAKDLTDKECFEWAYSFLNYFIDIYGMDCYDEEIYYSNVDIEELKKAVHMMFIILTNDEKAEKEKAEKATKNQAAKEEKKEGNKMKEKLYTNKEHEFLTGLLDLLKVPYTSTKHNDGITYNEVVFEPTTAQYEVIYTAMKYHYKEVMTR